MKSVKKDITFWYKKQNDRLDGINNMETKHQHNSNVEPVSYRYIPIQGIEINQTYGGK